MGLKVWLPLNGNLNNIGNSNIIPINHGAIVDTAGKIGQCYSFNGSDQYIDIGYGNGILAKNLSVALWVKPLASLNSKIVFGSTVGTNQRFYLGVRGGTWELSYGSVQWNTDSTATVDLNIWQHLVMTVDDNGIVKLYKNGTYTNETITSNSNNNFNLASNISIGGRADGYYSNCAINDFRLYDHCLSDAEVREISQGLILHYKLDQNITVGENIMPNSLNMPLGSANPTTGTWRTAGSNNMTRSRVAITDTPEGSGYGFQNSGIQTANDGSCYGIDSFPLEANTNYVISMWARITEGTEGYAGFNIYSSTPIEGWQVINKNYYSTRLATDGSWTRCWMSFKTNTATTRNIYIGITTGSTSVTTQMCNVHIEKGSLIDSNIIKDSSGYGYHGTIVGTPTIQSDSRRYSSSIYSLDGTVSRITTPTIYFPTDKVTLNIWFKSTNTSPTNNYHMVVDSNTHRQWYEMAVQNNGQFRSGLFVNGTRYANNCSPTTVLNGQWHMLTVLYDGTAVRRYVDTVESNSQTVAPTTGLSTPTALTLFRDGPNASYACKEASISDFRIYCTALDVDAIRQLYEVGAKVDNKGNLHTFELNEQASNIFFNIEKARTNLTFTDGLSKYTQSNCQVTLTEQGYHIYRPPNLTTANDGNTMWGGLLINNQTTRTIAPYDPSRDNTWNLQQNHTYIFAFHAKGQSSNSPSLVVESNMGWDRIAGVGPNPTYLARNTIPANFNGEQDCYIIFKIEDDIVKVATENKSSYVQGNSYLSYRELCLNYVYTATGTLGTDLYLTNFRLYDITNHIAEFTKMGQAKFYNFVEQMNKCQIRKNSELLSTEFIEI